MRQFLSRYGRLAMLLMLLCVLVLTGVQPAAALREDEVRRAVETWVRQVTADARPHATVQRMDPYYMEGEIVAYIAHLEGGGFCLTGADELVLPVYLYVPDGAFDPGRIDFENVLLEIGSRYLFLRAAVASNDPAIPPYRAALADRAAFWQALIAGRPPRYEPEAGEPTLMELNLTSQWGQGSPYNDQCPDAPTGSGTHTLVGCVATATAQVMRYWRWPHSGFGSASVTYTWRDTAVWLEEPLATDPGIPANWGGGRLEWTSANGGRLRMNGLWDLSIYYAAYDLNTSSAYRSALWTLYNRLTGHSQNYSANFGSATYDWSLLQDQHTDPPGTDDAEAAELSHHVGLAVDMQYGLWSSLASTSLVPGELANHFYYDGDGIYVAKHAASIDELTADVQWLRPVVIRGCGNGCHAWVLFGYNKATDPARQFKMNLGWNGGSDGWYSLDSVVGFDNNQYYVRYLAPENVVKFVGGAAGGDGSPANPYVDVAAAAAGAPGGAKLIFKAGSVNTFTASSLTISTPMTLHGKDVTIRQVNTP